MRIRRLPEGTINRIAAGEVIERPASAVKELVENAIDAGSHQIDVAFRGGGKTLIRVSDDGSGMAPADLALAIERHATSKLPDDGLEDIRFLGFRGEALPSIGAVSRLTITSRPMMSESGHAITVEGGRVGIVRPAAIAGGTEVEVRDLFFATPARLKFLKTDRTETAEAAEIVRRLALAQPEIGFSFATEERRVIDVPAGEDELSRIRRLLGAEFSENAVAFDEARDGVRLRGLAGLPVYARAQSAMQYVFVNGRPVRDRLLAGAIRGAYADVMAANRFPAIVLFIEVPPGRVDVNVHPAKTEVRFRDGGSIRQAIVGAVRRALASQGGKPGQSLSQAAASSFRPFGEPQAPAGLAETQAAFTMDMPVAAPAPGNASASDHPLGAARAQLHGNYIVSQTAEGIMLVDQHAAHERLVYERLKRERAERGIAIQPLLVPEVVDLDPVLVERITAAAGVLSQSGLVMEAFGGGAVIVREVPAALGQADIKGIVRAVADELAETENSTAVEDRINRILATMACHHSVRAGRILKPEEMDALLREMEATPNSGTCNHGRPTFIELKLADIERLFRRR